MKNCKLNVVLLLIFLLGITSVKSQNAEQLLQYMDDIISAPIDKQATVKIILTDKNGKEKIREASLKQKGKFKKLYRYTKPEKQAGIATLSLPDDKLWLYMPAFKKPIKISLLSKSQAFTGTDFSYEDMSGNSYGTRYTPKLAASNNEEMHIIELTPKTNKSKYSKIILYQDKTHFYPVKMEYFNKNQKYIKIATYQYAKNGKYWYAREVLMTDVQKNHSTQIIMMDIKFDQGIEDDVFLVDNLKQ